MAAPIHQLFPEQGPPPAEEPNSTEILPGPSNPLPVARIILDELTEANLQLLKWRGDWLRYQGPHWVSVDPDAIRKHLYERLEFAKYEKPGKDGQTSLMPWAPDKGKVDKLIDAMAAPAHLDRDVEAPSWLSTGEPARGYVPCLNGLVDVNTREIRPSTPDYFGTVGIPLEYNPDAGEPVEWLKFLRSIFPTEDGSEPEEIQTVRQWFGYVLSGRLDLQKMLLVIGQKRSGKGTLAKVLEMLVGSANTTAFTLSSLAQNFGLADTIGKTLSVVGDARLGSVGTETVVERLLSITGQDTITLDRKNRTAWTGRLQTRIVILSNEMPKFIDASGAIASRFIILKTRASFYGREDTGLLARLEGELPEILKWALEGLDDLQANGGRFHETEAHQEQMKLLDALVSPIGGFVDDVIDLGDPNALLPFKELYAEYKQWCDENGRGVKNTAGFSSDLQSRLPGLRTDIRPRDEQGRKMPRHVKGVRFSTDWTTRIRDTPNAEEFMSSAWRESRGGW